MHLKRVEGEAEYASGSCYESDITESSIIQYH